MKVNCISVARPSMVSIDGREVSTAIFKQPIEGPVLLGRENIDGDGQADLSVHGGRDKAVYLYSADYYPAWAAELGRPELEPAQFGENLTVDGCRDDDVVIGSRYRLGSAEIVVTQPRIPCFKLEARLGVKGFARTFWEKGRLGFYARVETPAEIMAGDTIELLQSPEHRITVRRYWEIVVNAETLAARTALECLVDLDAGAMRRLRNVAASASSSKDRA